MARETTKTGGREATTRNVPGDFALSVGLPTAPAPDGWQWIELKSVARMESGHTPSRKHPEYWDGDIPWIGIRDAKAHHGSTIFETTQTTNALGIRNSSARVLPAGTVCLSRTASVGYVVMMNRPMATSQDFANWICSEKLDPRFLVHLLIAEKNALFRFASGATHQTIYYPELKALHVCLPPLPEQKRIVAILDEAFEGISRAEENARKNLANARELFESYLNGVFSRKGEGWVETELGEIADFKNGLNFTKGSKGERIKIVGVKNFQSNFWVPIDGLDTAQIDGVLSDAYTLRENDILAVRSNGNKQLIGRIILAKGVTDKTSHSGFTIRIRVRSSKVDPVYLARYLKSGSIRDRLVASGDGANISSLNQKSLSSLPVLLPKKNEQSLIITKIEAMESESAKLLEIYRQKLSALANLKQSLLQKAFAGDLTATDRSLTEEAAA